LPTHKGRIVFVGDEKRLKEEVRLEENGVCIDGTGLVGLPGFVDSHTHLPFVGTREEEFVLRLTFFSYSRPVS